MIFRLKCYYPLEVSIVGPPRPYFKLHHWSWAAWG